MKAALAIAVTMAAASVARGGEDATTATETNTVATYSIVAADPETGEVGVAVASRFLAVGTIVPWAKAEVGAVATQAYSNTTYGPRGLSLLEEGMTPKEVIKKLTGEDPEATRRQVGIVNAKGEAATFTGTGYFPVATDKTGKNYAVQGNLLAEGVIEAMAAAFEKSEAPLPERLLEALEAGDEAGGDVRGKQSAALLVVRKGWGFLGQNERFRDLRVEDHEEPVAELRRLFELHRKKFPRPKQTETVDDEKPAEE